MSRLEAHQRRREWVDVKTALSRIRAWYADPTLLDETEGIPEVDPGTPTTKIKYAKSRAFETILKTFMDSGQT